VPRTRTRRPPRALRIFATVHFRCPEYGSQGHSERNTPKHEPAAHHRRRTDLICLICDRCIWTEGVSFLQTQSELRLAIVALTALIAFVIAEAYVVPANRGPSRSFMNAMFAASVSVVLRSVLLAIDPSLAVSPQIVVFGGCMSAVCLSGSRILFPPHPRAIKAGPLGVNPLQDLGERSKAFRKAVWRGNLELMFGGVLLSALGIWAALSDRVSDRAVGGGIIVTALYILYQVHRKGRVGAVLHTTEPASPALYRSQLEHRRDVLLTIGSWYVLPYLGALLAFALRLPFSHPERPDRWPNIIPFIVLSVAWSIAMKKLSSRAAKKLQDEIDSF
jgi:hypothetical protein